MDQERPHGDDAAARNEALFRLHESGALLNLLMGHDAATMSAGKNAQRPIGRSGVIEMQPQSQDAFEGSCWSLRVKNARLH